MTALVTNEVRNAERLYPCVVCPIPVSFAEEATVMISSVVWDNYWDASA